MSPLFASKQTRLAQNDLKLYGIQGSKFVVANARYHVFSFATGMLK